MMDELQFPLLLGQDALKIAMFGEPASSQANANDNMFLYIGYVMVVSFVVLMIAMVWFVVKYRRRAGVPATRTASHNTPLELTWSIVPLLLMVPMFFFGMTGYLDKQASPGDAEEIRITGQQWNWTVSYSNGGAPKEYKLLASVPSPVICVPLNKPVKFIFNSKDVLHAFYIPAFRTKIDVTPNRYTSLWFEPIKVTEQITKSDGTVEFDDLKAFCAEYCGQNHSEMAAWVRVLPNDQFKTWKASLLAPDESMSCADKGAFYYRRFGCASCHSVDGSKGTGPSWKNLWGSQTISFNDGSSLDISTTEAFMNYVTESVYTPGKKIHVGFTNQMVSFQGVVKQEQLDAIICYLQTIGSKPAPGGEEAPAAPAESGGANPASGGGH